MRKELKGKKYILKEEDMEESDTETSISKSIKAE